MPSLLQERKPDVHIPGMTGRRRVPVRLILAGAGLVLLVPLAGWVGDALPNVGLPEQKVVERSTPPLMLALDDLEEYHAATGTFQVVIDREFDTSYLPSAISGERVSFLATGTVDAYVDFGDLDGTSVQMSDDRREVTITLPAPQLGEADIDPDQSRVLDRDRGLVERIGDAFAEDPSDDGEFYALAEDRLAGAAADGDLLGRAEENTRTMLTTLAGSLGFERVTVAFEAPTDDR